MEDTIDLLKIKIEEAKRELPLATINAINAVDWRAAILRLRNTSGYTFEQLGDLETETELVLCGLLSPQEYPRELSKRMGISKSAADALVNEMNESVFKKIREELIKNTERKKIFAKNSEKIPPAAPKQQSGDANIFKNAGIEIVERPKVLPESQPLEIKAPISNPVAGTASPNAGGDILAQKLSSSFQSPVANTEHSLDNLTKGKVEIPVSVKTKTPGVDPYREIPE